MHARTIQRAAGTVSVVLIDLDHFKRVNDAHGHAVGDEVLRAAARALADSVRSVDAVGRYGGEEFLLVLPETDLEDAADIAEKLRRVVARTDLATGDGSRVAMTMSAGVAGGPSGSRHIDALIGDADDALDAAKSFGRDQIVVHRPSSEDGMVSRTTIDPDSRLQAARVGRSAMQAAIDVLVEAQQRRTAGTKAPTSAMADWAAVVAGSLGLPSVRRLSHPPAIRHRRSGRRAGRWVVRASRSVRAPFPGLEADRRVPASLCRGTRAARTSGVTIRG